MTNRHHEPNDRRDEEAHFDTMLETVSTVISVEEDLSFLHEDRYMGKYRVESLLAVGGQAICVLPEDEDLKRSVVLKLYQQRPVRIVD